MRASIPGGWGAALAALGVALGSSGCRSPRPELVHYQTAVAQARLPSGLRALAAEDLETNLVRLHVRVDVGSDADPPGKSGLAHLVEHLLFQGRDEAGRSWNAALAEVTLDYNASTGPERTEYMSTASADRLTALLAIEGRRFAAGCRGISQDTFAREREVVQNELSLRQSAPRGGARMLAAIVPADHPYARKTAGTVRDLASITLDDVCAFLAAHYRPDRIVVVMSGNLRAEVAAAHAARSFRRLARRAQARPPAPYPLIRPHRRVLRDSTLLGGEAGVVIAWPLPPRYQADSVAVDLAATNLEATLHTGPYPVRVTQMNGKSPLVIAHFVLPRGADTDDVLAFVRRAAARTAGHTSTRELAMLRHRRLRERFEEVEGLAARVELLAQAFQRAGLANPIALEMAALARLTPDEVSRAAARVFPLSNAVVLEVDPREEPGVRAELRPSGIHASHDDAILPPVDPADADRPLVGPTPRSRLDRARRFRLPSGLDLVVLPVGSTPLVNARLVFRGGAADDPPDQAGLAWVAASTLMLAPAALPDAEAAKRLAWINADTDARVTDDLTELSTTALAPHLRLALASLAWRVRSGQYFTANIELADRLYAATGSRAGTQLGWLERAWALRAAIDRALYGPGHPYARVAAPWERRGRRFSLDDLQEIRETRFGAHRATLIITGQVDVARARALAEELFDDLRPGRGGPAPRPPPPVRSARVVIERVAHPADTDAVIEIAFPTAADPGRRAARAVLARILDERLSQVRQVLGASYAVGAHHESRSGSGRFLIRAVVDARRVDEALVAIEDSLAELRAGGAAGLAASFVRARRGALGRLLAEGAGATGAADRLVELIRQDALWSQGRLARELMQLTAADIASLIAGELRPSTEVLGLLAPREALEAARRAAGLSGATGAR